MIIDNKLSWKDNSSFVCREVARGIGVITKARKVLRSETLKCLYYSFKYSYVINCNQVWGSACKSNIEHLQVLPKRAVRIILGVQPRSPSEPLFPTLQFLNRKNIFKYLIRRLMHRIYHGELRVLHGLFTKIAIYDDWFIAQCRFIISNFFKTIGHVDVNILVWITEMTS